MHESTVNIGTKHVRHCLHGAPSQVEEMRSKSVGPRQCSVIMSFVAAIEYVHEESKESMEQSEKFVKW